MVRKLDKRISGYRVRQPRNQKRTILIALEGKNKTERLYFNHFNNRNNDYIIIFAKGNTTDPVNMIYGLIKEIDIMGLDVGEGDKVYCVFDADANESKNIQIKKALDLANRYGIEIITSNPCFEEWILCHFDNSTATLSNKEALKKVKTYFSKYDKNYDIYPNIADKTELAIKNAKSKENYHLKQGKNIYLAEANPSSLIYKIIESLK